MRLITDRPGQGHVSCLDHHLLCYSWPCMSRPGAQTFVTFQREARLSAFTRRKTTEKKKKKKKRIGCQRDSIYSFSLTAGKDKWLKRDRNCLPINRVPVGLSPDAADHAEGRRQEEAGEATITPRQGLFGARSQTSLTYAPWVESAYVTKQHEVAAPRYLCVSRAARGPLPVPLVCSLAGSHVT